MNTADESTDDATLIREAVAELKRCAPLEVVLRPTTAFHLCALLQLTLRHPGITGESHRVAVTFIENLRAYFAHSDAPTIVEMLRRGDDPAYDVRTDRDPE